MASGEINNCYTTSYVTREQIRRLCGVGSGGRFVNCIAYGTINSRRLLRSVDFQPVFGFGSATARLPIFKAKRLHSDYDSVTRTGVDKKAYAF